MRLSVRAPRRARPELFVNYISRAFIAPEPRATQKPPPPPQTASLAPGAPASRRSGCDGSAGPEVSGSPTRDLAPEKGGVSPAGEGRGRYAGQVRPGAGMGPATAQRGLCRADTKDPASLPLDPLVCHPRPWAMRLGRGNLQLPRMARGRFVRVLQPWMRRHGTGLEDPRGWGRGPVRGLSLHQPRADG